MATGLLGRLVLAVAPFQLDSPLLSLHQEGQLQTDQLLLRAREPASCWARAVGALHGSCRSLDEAQRARLAVRFTNCHLRRSGLGTYPCAANMTVAACTRPMVDSPSAIAFKAYTTFSTHVDSICFYLQSEAFQQSAEAAVDALHTSTLTTATRLSSLSTHTDTALAAAEAIHRNQHAAALAADALLAGQREAAASLHTLQRSQATAFEQAGAELAAYAGRSLLALDNLRAGAEELRAKQESVASLLDRLLALQRLLMDEVGGARTLAVYALALLLLLLLTGSRPTAPLRLPLLLLLLSAGGFERGLASAHGRGWLGLEPSASAAALWVCRARVRRLGATAAGLLLCHRLTRAAWDAAAAVGRDESSRRRRHLAATRLNGRLGARIGRSGEVASRWHAGGRVPAPPVPAVVEPVVEAVGAVGSAPQPVAEAVEAAEAVVEAVEAAEAVVGVGEAEEAEVGAAEAEVETEAEAEAEAEADAVAEPVWDRAIEAEEEVHEAVDSSRVPGDAAEPSPRPFRELPAGEQLPLPPSHIASVASRTSSSSTPLARGERRLSGRTSRRPKAFWVAGDVDYTARHETERSRK